MIAKQILFSSRFSEELPHPKPALHHIPSAYKNMQSFYEKNLNRETIKKCVPFLDALTCGYIIPFASDIQFVYEDGQAKFFFPENMHPDHIAQIGIEYHSPKQIDDELRYNRRTVDAVFKFINHWNIKTPPGYSCIFTQPFNRNLPFQIIDGIVDTDSYNFQTHFPFYWTQDSSKTHVLKKGDPMILLIPFKRDDWKMKVALNKESYIDESKRKLKFFNVLLDNYKKFAWRKKSYK